MPVRQTLTGRGLTLRPATEQDAPAILEVLREPAVAAWWGTTGLDDVLQALGVSLVIDVDGAVGGVLHVHEEDDPEYRHAALDIALATRAHGRGLGREALRTVIRHLVAAGHHRFTIDPAVANQRAIRCYAGVGFKPVGVLRRYERDPAGGWRDGLLMDLLAEELS